MDGLVSINLGVEKQPLFEAAVVAALEFFAPVTPEFLVAVVGLSVAHTRQIRSQRVVPNVKHLLGIARPGHAPLDPLATDGNVAQAALDEAGHLVAPEVRLHEVRVVLVVLEQPVLKRRQLEEIVPFADQLARPPADRTIGGLGAVGNVELAVNAVPTFIMPLVDVPGLLGALEHALHRNGMVRPVSVDEVRIVDIEQLPEGLDLLTLFGDKRLRSHASRNRRPLQFLTVFVGPRQKGDVVTALTLVAGEGVA